MLSLSRAQTSFITTRMACDDGKRVSGRRHHFAVAAFQASRNSTRASSRAAHRRSGRNVPKQLPDRPTHAMATAHIAKMAPSLPV